MFDKLGSIRYNAFLRILKRLNMIDKVLEYGILCQNVSIYGRWGSFPKIC